MKIHEYQAKALFKQFGLPVPEGFVANNIDEVKKAVESLGGGKVVLKAQVHAGGRGKAGGIRIVEGVEEAQRVSSDMFGMRLVTPQTGQEGKIVHTLYVEKASEIDRELYLALLIDRETEDLVFVASTEGGMEIEKVAAEFPEKIFKIHIDPFIGVLNHHTIAMLEALGLDLSLRKELFEILDGMFKLFIQKDCSLVEINPLIVTKKNHLTVLDAKVNFDDNGLYRHPEIKELEDIREIDKKELEASKYKLNYIALEGNIGCMVNGAGLAMATMDIIKYYGGEPANFLDVGGGAKVDQIKAAFKILTSDEHVKAILVNIFGGIMKCDVIAEGIRLALSETTVNVPVVVRLQGTNVEKGREIINNLPLKVYTAETLYEAAELAVKKAKENSL